MKTSELSGPALDWAVAKLEGVDLFETEGWVYPEDGGRAPYKPSTNWSQGGPIIEREKITLVVYWNGLWVAEPEEAHESVGETPLIAAMRCYCSAILGDEIETPKELQPCQQPSL